MQAEHAVHAQKTAGNRPGDHHGDGLRKDEQPQNLAPVAHREPLGDVVQNARKETGFGHPQQKTHHIKTVRPLHKGHANGDGAPGDHDAGKPASRAEALKHQVAGDFHQEVTDEEQARAQAIGGVANADVGPHVQFGEAHCRAIHVGNQVEQDQKGNQFERDATNKPEFLAHETVSHCFCYGTSGVASGEYTPGSALSRIDYIVILFTQQHFQTGFLSATLGS